MGSSIAFRPVDLLGTAPRGWRKYKVNVWSINRPPRSVVATWLGLEPGLGDSMFCDPHPDHQDPLTGLVGLSHRILAKSPKIDHNVLNKFSYFVSNWLETNLVPLVEDASLNMDYEAVVLWLSKTDYPLYRREQLLREFVLHDGAQWTDSIRDYYNTKSFFKDEFYQEFKNARSINSRCDFFKTVVGPIFKGIEKILFSRGEFIKKIPVQDRAKYIHDRLFSEGACYFASDFTSFESSFSKQIMMACEFALYRHMTQNLSCGDRFMTIITEALAGMNFLVFKNFGVEVEATRMSGEMCTSLGNSFTNLMVNLFILSENGCKDVECVVEGDDGLYRFNGVAPTSDHYAKLGFEIKLVVEKELHLASFCGLVYDPIDLKVLADPMKVLLRTCWGDAKYKDSRKSKLLSLLKAKALSIVYQYDGCPVVSSYGHWLLRRLARVSIVPGLAMLEKNEYKFNVNEMIKWAGLEYGDAQFKLPRTAIGIGSRYVIQEKFGFAIENQLTIEHIFDNDDDFPCELLMMLYPNSVYENCRYIQGVEDYGCSRFTHKIPPVLVGLRFHDPLG